MDQKKCPICSSDVRVTSGSSIDIMHFDCQRCGNYKISFVALMSSIKFDSIQIANASGYLRENNIQILDNDTLERLKTIKTPTVAEKAKKIFVHLAKNNPTPGYEFNITHSPNLLGISWAQNYEELDFLIEDYLINTKHFVESMGIPYRITPHGFAYLDELDYKAVDSQIGFIAMWFDPTLDTLLGKVLIPAIEGAGYEPKRIDKHEHVNKIDDEIVAMIRRSKFIVADFTGHRGGVYFEAGYGMGLNLPVFWMCKEEDLKDTHFDTRQYNFIKWQHSDLETAKNNLQYRIESVIGRGKYRR